MRPFLVAMHAKASNSLSRVWRFSWCQSRLNCKSGLALLWISSLHVFTSVTPGKAQLMPADFETPEFYANWGLNAINAQEAYAQGFTGVGIRIAIADSPIQWSHPEFSGRIFYPGLLPVFPVAGYELPTHGTHVSGIAAAGRNGFGMMGVAFEASIALVRATSADGYPKRGKYYDDIVASGAKVANGSFGAGSPPRPLLDDESPNPNFFEVTKYYAPIGAAVEAAQGLQKLAEADVVMVYSAGNDRQTQRRVSEILPTGVEKFLPLITPENTSAGNLYQFLDFDGLDLNNPSTWKPWDVNKVVNGQSLATANYSGLAGSFVVVGAVDSDLRIAEFSNYCGAVKAWCLVAPGVGIYSSWPMDLYNKDSGTSMAAPHVTGAAAILRQAFPYMTARQIIEVMLTNSTDIGEPGIDSIYGHGLLNLGQAVHGPIKFASDPIFASIFAVDTQGYDSVWSNNISGVGGLSKSGKGTLTMKGSNTYTGNTTVSDGTLRIDGSISSSALTVEDGGKVQGTGTLGPSVFRAGSVHSPGNSIGIQSFTGNYALSSGAQLLIEVQGPRNDKLSVSGNALLDGEVVILPFEGGAPFPFFDYQVINSSSDIVFNGSVNQDLLASALLSYGADLVVGNDGDPTTLDIAWLPKNGVGVVGSALTRLGNNESNQKSTAAVLDNSLNTLAVAAGVTTGTSGKNASGEAIGKTGFTSGQAAAAGYSSDFIRLLDDLVQLSSPGQLAAAINSLSPEPYAAFQAVGLNSLKQQRELLATHAGSCQDTGWVVSMPNNESSVPGKTGAKLPICVFAEAAKSNSSINGSEGLSSYLSNSNIAYWGLEYFPSKQWTVGAAYGYGSSSLYGMSLTSAGVSSTNTSGAVYSVYKPNERLKLQGAFGYTAFAVEGTRTVAYIGNGQPINGNTSANGYTASLDAKYDILINTGSKKDWLVVSPIAGIAWGAYQQKGFVETGGAATDLQVNGHTSNSLVGTIGFELSTTPIKLSKSGKQSFAPRLALAYQVDALANANYTKELAASFVDAPAAGVITTQGQNGGANSFTIAAGGDLQISQNAVLYASVSYEVENAGSQFGYSGGVRFLF
jgi:autotransporter-associated beta strand protein